MADTAPSPFPSFVYNFDICYVADKIARFTEEVMLCVSSNSAQVGKYDMARLKAYLASVDKWVGFVTGQPELDLPKSHPMGHAIKPFPASRDLENDELDHMVRLLRSAYIETVNSASARDGAGLKPADSERITAIVSKARQWLDDYVSTQTPMDLPESSPQEPMSPAGKLGV